METELIDSRLITDHIQPYIKDFNVTSEKVILTDWHIKYNSIAMSDDNSICLVQFTDTKTSNETRIYFDDVYKINLTENNFIFDKENLYNTEDYIIEFFPNPVRSAK